MLAKDTLAWKMANQYSMEDIIEAAKDIKLTTFSTNGFTSTGQLLAWMHWNPNSKVKILTTVSEDKIPIYYWYNTYLGTDENVCVENTGIDYLSDESAQEIINILEAKRPVIYLPRMYTIEV